MTGTADSCEAVSALHLKPERKGTIKHHETKSEPKPFVLLCVAWFYESGQLYVAKRQMKNHFTTVIFSIAGLAQTVRAIM